MIKKIEEVIDSLLERFNFSELTPLVVSQFIFFAIWEVLQKIKDKFKNK